MPAGQDQHLDIAARRSAPAVEASLHVPTAARMRDLGARLAGLLRPGDVVVLSGGLGSGKTTLTQGIGAGLGVRGPVTSPTFVIARVHPSLRGGPDLVHADAYRLGSRAEVDDLDLDTDIDSSVTVVEWGEGLVEDLAPSFLQVDIALAPDAGPGKTSARTGPAPGPPACSGPSATGPAATAAAADADEARVVRVAGWGDRWQRDADLVRQALSGATDTP
jgi:tRNA threonylcarbamoyladenosine biosynthesis protein TsaE